MKNTNIHITRNIFLTGCVLTMLTLTSCSKNSPLSPNCLSGSWIENVETDLTAWVATAQLYSDNPTKENCENNKKAGLGYISALNKFKNCVPSASTAEFDVELKEAKAEINATICD